MWSIFFDIRLSNFTILPIELISVIVRMSGHVFGVMHFQFSLWASIECLNLNISLVTNCHFTVISMSFGFNLRLWHSWNPNKEKRISKSRFFNNSTLKIQTLHPSKAQHPQRASHFSLSAIVSSLSIDLMTLLNLSRKLFIDKRAKCSSRKHAESQSLLNVFP